MKRIALVCLCTFALMSMAFAIEVDQSELKQTENTSSEFINYTGSHDDVDTGNRWAELLSADVPAI